MAAIFSPLGLGWTAKYASRDLFSGAAIEVLFFSPAGRRPLVPSGSLLAASASSSQARRTGFSAIILLCDRVKDSNLQMVLCERAPTPGNLRFARAFPTSA